MLISRSLIFSLFVFSGLISFGQDTLKKPVRDFPDKAGIVAYYFWEEDSLGNIVGEPKKPFLQNYLVEIPESHSTTGSSAEKNGKASLAEVMRTVDYFAAEPGTSESQEEYYFEDSLKKISKLRFPLHRTKATEQSSVIFRKTNGVWESFKGGPVVSFVEDEHGKMQFFRTSEFVRFGTHPVRDFKSAGQYTEIFNGENQKVLNYEGKDVTDLFGKDTISTPARMLLFINGYRGPKRNNEPSDGLVTQKDRYGYWYKLDNQFTDVLKPDVSYFVDGSLPISTSNHRTKGGFVWSYLRTKLTLRKNKSRIMARRLNTEGNNPGFDDRIEKGKLGGLAFLAARCNSPECEKTVDTIDIVCHSMGYAYALGFLEVTDKRFVLGNIYILAPENACYKGYDWSKFQHVWQYGSDLDQENPSSIRKQDGIAPQCAVKGLDKLAKDKGGRAFFPKDWPNQNFIDSHMIYSYDWIFQRIQYGEPGFVTRKF